MIRILKLLWDMFEPAERRRFRILIAIVCVSAVFEVMSLASVLPFLQVLSNPGSVETIPALALAYRVSGAATPADFARILGFVSISLIVVGMTMRVGAVYAITRFSAQRSYTISTRLLAGFMARPYPWFLNRNASELSKVILSETQTAISNGLVPTLRVVQAGVTAVLTIGLLVAVEPLVAGGAMAAIGLSYLAVFLILRGPLQRAGERRLAANRRRFRLVYEAMNGIKEIKFLGLEQGLGQEFSKIGQTLAREQTFVGIAGQVPRYILEGVAFGGLILVVLILTGTRQTGIADLVPVFGLLVVAMARLFPALQTLYNQSATLRSNQAALNMVHTHLVDHGKQRIFSAVRSRDRPAPLSPQQMISLRGITYSYPQAAGQSLSDLSLDIPVGARVGIVGGTGAGKTTLIDVLLGLLRPQQGEILVDGQQIGPQVLPAWQGAIGYVPQNITLWDMSVARNIAFGLPAEEIDRARIEAAARLAKLHDFVVSDLEQGYDTVIGDRGVRLSGGQRQRIGIARALYTDPSVLIFDEATSALDTVTERALMSAIEDLSGKMTVVMVAHRLSTVRSCDRIFLLEKGRIAASGTYDELVAGNETFRNMARLA